MALRSIDQRYWTDPYVESLSATEKLVCIHLFSSAHTNLVGVFQASRRMIAFQTACPGPDVDAALERFQKCVLRPQDYFQPWSLQHMTGIHIVSSNCLPQCPRR